MRLLTSGPHILFSRLPVLPVLPLSSPPLYNNFSKTPPPTLQFIAATAGSLHNRLALSARLGSAPPAELNWSLREGERLGLAQSLAPAPAPTSDGASIDQGIACVLMLLALVLTYLIHAADMP
ncbi:hypothetical protein FH972_012851 [Carpinus fangiana]|uniref:Uncharacterized protein n=1 Tax=Carpinus fangiana TaxID=176857 RepID=A0A5N6R6M2_9ROSI|nr:hypothetical protein FH972_012851 [Carpinus fangiana]